MNEKEINEKELETSKKKLLSEDVGAYQEAQDSNFVNVVKDDDDSSEHKISTDEDIAKDEKELIVPDEYKHVKVKFKKEYVDNHIILSVNHLKQYFSFGSGIHKYKLKAVHDVSFQIKEGECFGLVGESGCGKTTTGRSIIRLYDITSGSIYYKGYRIGAGSRWNEKEIKYTKIRLYKKLKELKEKLKKGEISKEIFEKESNDAKEHARKIVEVQKAKIKQIRKDEARGGKGVVNTVKEAKEALKVCEANSEAKINEIKSYYEEKIKTSTTDAEKNSLEKDCQNEVKMLQETLNKEIEKKKEALKEAKVESKKNLMNEIQMIFQDPIDSLDPRMTVESIISEGLIIQGKRNKAENHKAVVEALNKVGLIEDYANRYPHEFSGGQRQRIGIARALVMKPKLLICDEPISALDVSIRAQIINLLNDLKTEMNLSMLFIAHDLSVVKYFCDRIAVMYFGEIVELATSDELFKHPLHPYTKSLLSAIPKPNPLTEKERVRIVYNPREVHDYSVYKPKFVEIRPGHFVLANEPEIEKYNKEMEAIDAKLNQEVSDEEISKEAESVSSEEKELSKDDAKLENTQESIEVKVEGEKVSEEEKLGEDSLNSESTLRESVALDIENEEKNEMPSNLEKLNEARLQESENEEIDEESEKEETESSSLLSTKEAQDDESESKEELKEETKVENLSEKEYVKPQENKRTPSKEKKNTKSKNSSSKTRTKSSQKEVSETLLKQRSGEIKKIYHVKKVDGKWEIVLKDGLKAIKTFSTKVEAVEYANNLAKSQGGTVLVHASKGKNKGKFIK